MGRPARANIAHGFRRSMAAAIEAAEERNPPLQPTTLDRPFDDIRRLVSMMPEADAAALAAARAREAELVKAPGSLGRLEGLVEWLAAWQGRAQPTVDAPLVALFVATHGVAARDGTPPVEATQAMLATYTAGGAAISRMCMALNISFKAFELALEVPTGDITAGPAMDEKTCAATMAFGMEAVAGPVDLLCLGDYGIGNRIAASAILAALFGGDATDWAGEEHGLVEAALARHAGQLDEPLKVLQRLGGRELAAIAGAILAARLQRVPVLLDGLAVTAAAAVLHALDPRALDHCRFGHISGEPGHARAVRLMRGEPILDLGISLGEGTGAALAASLLRTAVAVHAGMATRREAGLP